MDMFKLALNSGLPLIYIRTDDTVNVADVLEYIAGEQVYPVNLPASIEAAAKLQLPQGRVLYTSSDCKSLAKLYRVCVDQGKTIVFINTDRSVIQFDGGTLLPPIAMVRNFLKEIAEDPDTLLPAFGGLTMKDVGEIAKLTMTRDESLTVRGVNETRRGYHNLKGISQVDTDLSYYVTPFELEDWLGKNAKMFTHPVHPSLIPRGLLFDGIPGTGKTLASKYIASLFGVPLYRLDLGGVMGKYVGDSESNLNAALAQIDQVEPCVVVLDEVEKVFQSQSDSGVTSRLLSQLLWWMQEHSSRVFTVMTTNDVRKIPTELHREGRIDATMQFMGIPNFKEGYAFAKGAFDSLVKEIGKGETNITANFVEVYKELSKRIKMMYADDKAVPQSKLTQAAYELVREILSKEGSDE